MASSQPPPSAKPLTAAMTGMSRSSIFLKTPAPNTPKSKPSCSFMVLIAAMSAPATKDLPAPVITRPRTSLSAFISSSTLSRSSSTWRFRAFSACSLEMVIIPTFPFTSYLSVSYMSVSLFNVNDGFCGAGLRPPTKPLYTAPQFFPICKKGRSPCAPAPP